MFHNDSFTVSSDENLANGLWQPKESSSSLDAFNVSGTSQDIYTLPRSGSAGGTKTYTQNQTRFTVERNTSLDSVNNEVGMFSVSSGGTRDWNSDTNYSGVQQQFGGGMKQQQRAQGGYEFGRRANPGPTRGYGADQFDMGGMYSGDGQAVAAGMPNNGSFPGANTGKRPMNHNAMHFYPKYTQQPTAGGSGWGGPSNFNNGMIPPPAHPPPYAIRGNKNVAHGSPNNTALTPKMQPTANGGSMKRRFPVPPPPLNARHYLPFQVFLSAMARWHTKIADWDRSIPTCPSPPAEFLMCLPQNAPIFRSPLMPPQPQPKQKGMPSREMSTNSAEYVDEMLGGDVEEAAPARNVVQSLLDDDDEEPVSRQSGTPLQGSLYGSEAGWNGGESNGNSTSPVGAGERQDSPTQPTANDKSGNEDESAASGEQPSNGTQEDEKANGKNDANTTELAIVSWLEQVHEWYQTHFRSTRRPLPSTKQSSPQFMATGTLSNPGSSPAQQMGSPMMSSLGSFTLTSS